MTRRIFHVEIRGLLAETLRRDFYQRRVHQINWN